MAFTLDGVVLARPTKAKRRKDSSVHWERVIVLGANLLLWTALILAVRRFTGGAH